MKFLAVFFLFLLGSVACAGKTTVDLKKILNNVNNIMATYNKELDQAVPIKELRASLVVLDSLAQNYHGECRQDIYDATQLGYKTASNYFKAIETVFKWCAKAEKYCSRLEVKDGSGNRLSADDPMFILSALLTTGLEAVVESITILETVRDNLTEMQKRLRYVPNKLKSELKSIHWEYTLQRQGRIRDVEEENKRREAEAAIQASSKLILGLLGPIGLAFGLAAAINDLNFPRAVLNQEVEATKSQQLAINDAFMKSLIKAVESTLETIATVKEELSKEITNLKALEGFVGGQLILLVEFEGDYPIMELQRLKKEVHDFTARHGGGSQRFRWRRELTIHGDMTWAAISNIVDEYMNRTARQREVDFWTLASLQNSRMAHPQNDFPISL